MHNSNHMPGKKKFLGKSQNVFFLLIACSYKSKFNTQNLKLWWSTFDSQTVCYAYLKFLMDWLGLCPSFLEFFWSHEPFLIFYFLANEDTPQLYVACGRGPRSSLRVLRHGLEVTEMAVSELPGNPNAVWTVKIRADGKMYFQPLDHMFKATEWSFFFLWSSCWYKLVVEITTFTYLIKNFINRYISCSQ